VFRSELVCLTIVIAELAACGPPRFDQNVTGRTSGAVLLVLPHDLQLDEAGLFSDHDEPLATVDVSQMELDEEGELRLRLTLPAKRWASTFARLKGKDVSLRSQGFVELDATHDDWSTRYLFLWPGHGAGTKGQATLDFCQPAITIAAAPVTVCTAHGLHVTAAVDWSASDGCSFDVYATLERGGVVVASSPLVTVSAATSKLGFDLSAPSAGAAELMLKAVVGDSPVTLDDAPITVEDCAAQKSTPTPDAGPADPSPVAPDAGAAPHPDGSGHVADSRDGKASSSPDLASPPDAGSTDGVRRDVGLPVALWANVVQSAGQPWATAVASAGGTVTVVGTAGIQGLVGSSQQAIKLPASAGQQTFVASFSKASGTPISAATLPLPWVVRVAASPDGAMVVLGRLFAPVSLTTASGTPISIAPVGGGDLYVAKVTSAGVVWVRTLGSPGTESPGGLAVAADGAIYVSGSFGGGPAPCSMTLDTAGTIVLTNPLASTSRSFVARLDGTGQFIWAKQTTGAASDASTSIAVSADGGAVVGGFFYTTTTFGSGEQSQTTLVAGQGPAGYVARFAKNGSLAWARPVTATSSAVVLGVAAIADAVFAVGTADGAAGLASSAGQVMLAGSGRRAFAVRLASDGQPAWATAVGGGTCGREIGANSHGVWISGTVDAGNTFTTDSGPVTAGSTPLAYLALIDPSGQLRWAVGPTTSASSCDNAAPEGALAVDDTGASWVQTAAGSSSLSTVTGPFQLAAPAVLVVQIGDPSGASAPAPAVETGPAQGTLDAGASPTGGDAAQSIESSINVSPPDAAPAPDTSGKPACGWTWSPSSGPLWNGYSKLSIAASEPTPDGWADVTICLASDASPLVVTWFRVWDAGYAQHPVWAQSWPNGTTWPGGHCETVHVFAAACMPAKQCDVAGQLDLKTGGMRATPIISLKKCI
jgi:hypothetical protein